MRVYVLAGPKFEMAVHQIHLLTRVEHEIVSKQDFGLPFLTELFARTFENEHVSSKVSSLR